MAWYIYINISYYIIFAYIPSKKNKIKHKYVDALVLNTYVNRCILKIHQYLYIHIYIHIYTYIHICVCNTGRLISIGSTIIDAFKQNILSNYLHVF